MEMELREGIAKLISVPKGCRDVLVWDTKTPGFFLRKFASGRAMWGVRYRGGRGVRQDHYPCQASRALSRGSPRGQAAQRRACLATKVLP